MVCADTAFVGKLKDKSKTHWIECVQVILKGLESSAIVDNDMPGEADTSMHHTRQKTGQSHAHQRFILRLHTNLCKRVGCKVNHEQLSSAGSCHLPR